MDSLLTLSSPPVNLNVPSSPPAYSRMPPDGHEFPQNYQEIGPNGTYELATIPAVPGSEPPSYTVDPYYTKKSAYIDVINEAKLLDVERKPSENDADSMKMAMSSHNKTSFGSKNRNGDETGVVPIAATRTRVHPSWRNDEKSERSVKDKIAMFSSAISKAGSNGTSTTSGNLAKSRHRSSEDNVALADGGTGSMLHSRVYSKSIYSMNSVGCRGGSYSDVMSTQPSYHHHLYGGPNHHLQQQQRFKSKDTYPVLHCQRASVGVDSTNPINIMNRTQSSIDLTLSSSSCSSAYSSCSPDSSLSPMSSPSYTIGSSSTLPRKHKSHHLTNGSGGPNNSTSCFSSSSSTSSSSSSSSSSYNDKKHTSLTRTTSFTGTTTLHSRSQSLVDVLHTPHRYGNYEDSAASRKDSLTTLIEQRRRTMSKLRGLVIPEKTCESQKPIIDLPEIKSKEADRFNCCPVTGHSTTRGIKQEHTTAYDSSWKSVLNASDMPKYSPAFKRKTLTVYGVSSSASSLSSSLNSSREELRSDNIVSKTNKSSPPAKPPRNSVINSYNNPQLLYGPPVYKSLFANNNSNTLHDKSTDKKDNKTLSNDSYSISRMDVCSKLQEDSDNDSAVSSSRSSLCQEYSPPSSPSPNTEYDSQTNDRISNDSPSQSSSRTLRRTLSSETNVSVTSTISTLTSGSQASCSSNGDNSGQEGKSKRILKAESVEAINRKNVLSSAKYSCGQDFKVGSPLIKDVFENHQNGIFNTASTTTAAGAATEDEDDDQTAPKFRLENDNSSANWYGTGENIKVAYLEIQDGEESDFSTKENSSSADTDDNLDKSLELMSDSLCDGNYTVVDYAKKDSTIKDSTTSSDNDEYSTLNSGDVPFTKLEKQVYAQVIKNQQQREDRRKSDRFLDSKITTSVAPTVVAAVPAIDTKPTIHVNDIRKTFEKAEPPVKMNGIKTSQNHLRMSSMDSTTSEDSLPTTNSGSASNLLKEQQFGSITSLASSTSLISQQELQQLIDEANQTLEETAGSGGHDLMVIILHRETVTSSIGITLAGGADYETKEITVHKVLVGSPADKDGRIQKGDRILSINGRNMKGVTHREALSILKAPRSEVVLVVSRWRTDGSNDNATPVPAEDTLVATFKNTIRPPRIPEVSSDCDSRNFTSSTANNNYSKIVKGPVISVTLIKEGGGLGFSLEGGKDSPFGDLPLTIKKIFTGGCAAKSGQLHAGDELLSLNGVDVTSMSRTEAWNMMKRLSDGQVILNVRRSSKE